MLPAVIPVSLLYLKRERYNAEPVKTTYFFFRAYLLLSYIYLFQIII